MNIAPPPPNYRACYGPETALFLPSSIFRDNNSRQNQSLQRLYPASIFAFSHALNTLFTK